MKGYVAIYTMLAAVLLSRLRTSAIQLSARGRTIQGPLHTSVPKACLGARTAATYTSRHQAAQISILQTAVDTNSATYVENARSMRELVDKFTSLHRDAAVGGSASAREKHVARGKMLVRE